MILYTEFWMVGVSTVLAAATVGGFMSPCPLLTLTFALSAGDAIETPTWRAILPELVQKEDLAAASALNGIEFNFARAVGPGLAGLVIAAAGVGAAFTLDGGRNWNRRATVGAFKWGFDGCPHVGGGLLRPTRTDGASSTRSCGLALTVVQPGEPDRHDRRG